VADAHASAYLRAQHVIVTSESKTTAGYWLSNGAFEYLPATVDDQELGAAIERMLARTEHEVPVPDWRAKPQPKPLAPVYAAVGVRGWRGFAGRALSVGVFADGTGAVEVTPSKREQRPRSGFEPLSAESENLDSPSHAALGAAVRRAFSKSA
jgi:hypothetical protein